MSYDLRDNIKIDWPNQANLPAGPAVFPTLEMQDVPNDLIGYDEISGEGDFIAGSGFQFRNNGSTILVFDRSRPGDILSLDANLATAIRDTLSLPETVSQEGVVVTRPITSQDVLGLVTLKVPASVASLTGIHNCTNLVELDLSDSAVVDLTPLRGLTNLRKLNCRNCPIVTAAALLDLPALELLNMKGVTLNAKLIADADALMTKERPVLVLSEIVQAIRQFDFRITDSVGPAPAGDEITMVCVIYKIGSVYSLSFVGVAIGPPNTLDITVDSFKLFDMDDNELFEYVGETVVLPSDMVQLIMGVDTKLIGYIADVAQISGNFESTETAGYIDNPVDGPLDFATLALDTAIKAEMTLLSGEGIERRWMRYLYRLSAPFAGITYLQELPYCTRLEYLDLSFNEIGTFNLGAILPNLTYLNLMNNDIDATDITTVNHPDLRYINLQNNTDLPKADCNALYLDFNQPNIECYVDRGDFDISSPISATPVPDTEFEGERVTILKSHYSTERRKFVTGGLYMIGGSEVPQRMELHRGDDCTEIGPDTLIKTFNSNFNLGAGYQSVDGVTNSTPTNINLDGHGYETGDCLYIGFLDSDILIYEIEVVDADNFLVLDTSGDYGYAGGGQVSKVNNLTHDDLALLPGLPGSADLNGNCVLVMFIDDEAAYQHVIELPKLEIELSIGNNDLLNTSYLPAITDLSRRTITDMTDDSPVLIESNDHNFDNMSEIDIVGVIGNSDINSRWTIHVSNIDHVTPVSSIGDAYVSGGVMTPSPSNAIGSVTTRFVRNILNAQYLCEVVLTYTQQNMQDHVIEEVNTGNRLWSFGMPDAELIDTIVFEGDTIYINEYTVSYNLNEGEIERISKTDSEYSYKQPAYLIIYTNTYPEGGICSPRDGFLTGIPEYGNVRIKIITTQSIEGLAIDDLIVTIPPIGDGPVYVGPFPNIFHATATVNGATYTDLIQMEFSSDVLGGQPLTGDIKVAALEIV